MNGDFMRRILTRNKLSSELDLQLREKIAAVDAARKGHELYAETSHVFIKSFGWNITEYIPAEKIGVVILERQKEAVVHSLHRINCLPTNALGEKWICTPKNCPPIVPYPVKFAALKCEVFRYAKRLGLGRSTVKRFEFQLLDWYVDVVTELKNQFLEQFPTIRTFTTSAERLNSMEEVHRLTDFFGLPRPNNGCLKRVLGKRANRKDWSHSSASGNALNSGRPVVD